MTIILGKISFYIWYLLYMFIIIILLWQSERNRRIISLETLSWACICNIFLFRDLRDRATQSRKCVYLILRLVSAGRDGVTSSSRESLARNVVHEFVYRKTLRFRWSARVWRISRRSPIHVSDLLWYYVVLAYLPSLSMAVSGKVIQWYDRDDDLVLRYLRIRHFTRPRIFSIHYSWIFRKNSTACILYDICI